LSHRALSPCAIECASDQRAVRELAVVIVTKNRPKPTTKRNRPMKSRLDRTARDWFRRYCRVCHLGAVLCSSPVASFCARDEEQAETYDKEEQADEIELPEKRPPRPPSSLGEGCFASDSPGSFDCTNAHPQPCSSSSSRY
jgi:hypothetical protein